MNYRLLRTIIPTAVVLLVLGSAQTSSAEASLCVDLFSPLGNVATTLKSTRSTRRASVADRTAKLESNLENLAGAKELFERVLELREKVKAYRNKNGAWETREMLDRRLRTDMLQSFILAGESDLAVKHFQVIFETVEFAYQKVVIARGIADRLRRDLSSGRIEEAFAKAQIEAKEREASDALASLLESYETYEPLRGIIDRVLAEGRPQDANAIVNQLAGNDSLSRPSTAQIDTLTPSSASGERFMIAAEDTHRRLGSYMESEPIREFYNQTRLILGSKFEIKRPTLAEINDLYNRESRSSEATLAKLKIELKEEFWLYVKLLIGGPQLHEAMLSGIAKLPAPLQKPVSTLVMLSYDHGMRRRHLTNIHRILRLPEDGAGIDGQTRIDMLRSLNSKYPGDEFLVTFARLVNGTRSWDAMKARVQALAFGTTSGATAVASVGANSAPNRPVVSEIWAGFFRRMEAAEKKADGRDLSLFDEVAPNYVFGTALWGGAAASGYYIYNRPGFDQVLEGLKSVSQAVIMAGGGG